MVFLKSISSKISIRRAQNQKKLEPLKTIRKMDFGNIIGQPIILKLYNYKVKEVI